MDQIILFSGSSNLPLSTEIANHLGVEMGKATLTRFADGESRPWIQEDVRNKTVFIIQSLSNPVDQNFIEMSLLADAIHRGSPKKMVAVIPYMGYSRQDRQHRIGEPISAKVIAKFIEASKFDEVITIELHNNAIQGFFQIPVTNISLTDLYVSQIMQNFPKDVVIVSPDVGNAKKVRFLADKLGVPQITLEKKRSLDQSDVSESKKVYIDLTGKTVIIVDDMISTGGTIANTAGILRECGAARVIVVAAHGVLSGNAFDTLEGAGIEKVIISNSIDIGDRGKPWTFQLSVAPLLAETIKSYIK